MPTHKIIGRLGLNWTAGGVIDSIAMLRIRDTKGREEDAIYFTAHGRGFLLNGYEGAPWKYKTLPRADDRAFLQRILTRLTREKDITIRVPEGEKGRHYFLTGNFARAAQIIGENLSGRSDSNMVAMIADDYTTGHFGGPTSFKALRAKPVILRPLSMPGQRAGKGRPRPQR